MAEALKGDLSRRRRNRPGGIIRHRTVLNVDSELLATIGADASKKGVSNSAWIEDAARYYLTVSRPNEYKPEVVVYNKLSEENLPPTLEEFLGEARHIILAGTVIPRKLQEPSFRNFITRRLEDGVYVEVYTLHPEISKDDSHRLSWSNRYQEITNEALATDLAKTHQAIDDLFKLCASRKVPGVRLGSGFGNLSLSGVRFIPDYDFAMVDRYNLPTRRLREEILGEFSRPSLIIEAYGSGERARDIYYHADSYFDRRLIPGAHIKSTY